MPEEMKAKLEKYLVENVAKLLKHEIDDCYKYACTNSKFIQQIMYGLGAELQIWSHELENYADIEEYARNRWKCLKK